MNRDTVYSGYIADVREGGSVTIPQTDGRYLSVMVVQNDHYIDQVFTTSGTHEIKAKTDFVMIAARTQINPNDPKDIENVKRFQSQIVIKTKSRRDHVMPDYDLKQLEAVRAKLVKEGSKFGSLNNMQGARGTIDERMHLLGTALGWGLLPDAHARYISYFSKGAVASSKNCSHATYKKPPINEDGFFSITVYNSEGWIANEQSILNDFNITYNKDGTFTAHFGHCAKDFPNRLAVADNWDMLLRVYEPKLDEMKAYHLPTPVVVQ